MFLDDVASLNHSSGRDIEYMEVPDEGGSSVHEDDDHGYRVVRSFAFFKYLPQPHILLSSMQLLPHRRLLNP